MRKIILFLLFLGFTNCLISQSDSDAAILPIDTQESWVTISFDDSVKTIKVFDLLSLSSSGANQNIEGVLTTGANANSRPMIGLGALRFSDTDGDGRFLTIREVGGGGHFINGFDVREQPADPLILPTSLVAKADLDAAIAGVSSGASQNIEQVLQTGNDANFEKLVNLQELSLSDDTNGSDVWRFYEQIGGVSSGDLMIKHLTKEYTFNKGNITEPTDIVTKQDLDGLNKSVIKIKTGPNGAVVVTENNPNGRKLSELSNAAVDFSQGTGFTYNAGVITATKDMIVEISSDYDFTNDNTGTGYVTAQCRYNLNSSFWGWFGNSAKIDISSFQLDNKEGSEVLSVSQGDTFEFQMLGGVSPVNSSHQYSISNWNVTIKEL